MWSFFEILYKYVVDFVVYVITDISMDNDINTCQLRELKILVVVILEV